MFQDEADNTLFAGQLTSGGEGIYGDLLLGDLAEKVKADATERASSGDNMYDHLMAFTQ